MIPILVPIIVALFMLTIASYYDLRAGEVPDKFSIGLGVIFLILSAIGAFNYGISFFSNTLLFGIIFFIIGYMIFLAGQWGGGDVKVLAGIGTALGYLNSLNYIWPNSRFFPYYFSPVITFFVDMAFVTIPYALIYTIILGIMKPAVFTEFSKNIKNRWVLFLILISFIPSLLFFYLGNSILGFVDLLIPVFIVLSVYLKTVENVALSKTILVNDLKEWDVVADDIVVDNKKIASKRNITGLTKEQIQLIQKLVAENKIQNTIRIKWGIKFVPILMIAFLLTLYVGNLLEIVFIYLL